jgi:hypothetical protein
MAEMRPLQRSSGLRSEVIGDKEYDVCLECWKALEEKLKGKGKEIRIAEPVILLSDPRESRQREDEEPQFPGSLP